MSLSKSERVEFDELKIRVERLEQWFIKRGSKEISAPLAHVELVKKRGRPKKANVEAH